MTHLIPTASAPAVSELDPRDVGLITPSRSAAAAASLQEEQPFLVAFLKTEGAAGVHSRRKRLDDKRRRELKQKRKKGKKAGGEDASRGRRVVRQSMDVSYWDDNPDHWDPRSESLLNHQ